MFDNNYTSSRGAVFTESINGFLIENCRFANNRADRGPAFTGHSSNNVIIRNSKFERNHASNHGGAIYQENTKLKVEQSRFLNNQGDKGGSFFLTSDNSALEVVNTLFVGNCARSEYSDIQSDNSHHNVKLTNVTMINGIAPNDWFCRFEGNITITNSIIQGHVSYHNDRPLVANNNCSIDDWSERGSGNITSIPLLTNLGYLRSGSPCIDAGTLTGAPSVDIDGVVRPANNGIDIGCQEFSDSDNDGIPDSFEIKAGLDPNDSSDASGDLDNDGVNNLQEYILGLEINNPDTDGDGCGDGEELTYGFDPLRFTSIIYIDASNGSDNADGNSQDTPKKTFEAAIAKLQNNNVENAILVAPGEYNGIHNTNLDFNGINIKIRSIKGPFFTIVDLGKKSRFLQLSHGETEASIDGLTIRNGNTDQGGAIYLDQVSFFIKNCIFKDNKASLGAAIYGNKAELNITNTMFDSNIGRNLSESGVIYMKDTCNFKLMNCTILPDDFRRGAAIYSAGSLKIINSIIGGSIIGIVPDINYSYTEDDYTESGEGNIIADPLLLPNGYLSSTSPCIDAGTNDEAPSTDLYGYTRPHNDVVDMGCLEYADDDNDGIADSYEYLICGRDLDPEKDDDNDGVNNLQEFLLGLNAISADTDGDGMSDGWELHYGLDPRHNDAMSDTDDDGLTNLEEYQAGTNPTLKDSDNDGIDDSIELQYGLNPLDPSDALADNDGDTITNRDEILTYKTDPNNADTDSDGIPDNIEIQFGMNPLIPSLVRNYGGGYRYDKDVFNDAKILINPNWNIENGSTVTMVTNDQAQQGGLVWYVNGSIDKKAQYTINSWPSRTTKLSWRAMSTDEYKVEVTVLASDDNIYTVTFVVDGTDHINASENHSEINLGSWLANGRWHWCVRDFVHELSKINPNVTMKKVTSVAFYGKVYFDDLCVLKYPDSDNDCIPDTVELFYGLDPNDPNDATSDLDSDGLNNYYEFLYGTAINEADSDGDEMSDGEEVITHASDPLAIDGDGDGLPDWWEIKYFGNLSQDGNGDFDGDGISNLDEYLQGRRPDKNAAETTIDKIMLVLYTILDPII